MKPLATPEEEREIKILPQRMRPEGPNHQSPERWFFCPPSRRSNDIHYSIITISLRYSYLISPAPRFQISPICWRVFTSSGSLKKTCRKSSIIKIEFLPPLLLTESIFGDSSYFASIMSIRIYVPLKLINQSYLFLIVICRKVEAWFFLSWLPSFRTPFTLFPRYWGIASPEIYQAGLWNSPLSVQWANNCKSKP